VAESVVVLVVAAGAVWESPVLELIGARSGMVVLKRCVDVDELLATSSAGQADAAVVALEAPGLDAAAVDLLHRHQVQVVAIAGGSEAARTRAARVGADVLVDDRDLAGLPDVIADQVDPPTLAFDEQRDAEPAAVGRRGRVCVVWGPAGAPGRTTLATSVATVLARRALDTTLVDADPYGGAVAQHLGVLDEVSGLLVAARLTAEGALEVGAASYARTLGDHLTVVTGLPRGDRWREVRPGVVEHLLAVAAGRGPVLVDTGFSLEDDPSGDMLARPGRNHLTLGALDVADEVLVVGSADPVGLARLARGLVDLRDRVAGRPVHVVVNRMRPGLGWSERDVTGMVEGFARLASVHFVPDDRLAADRALTAGVSLAEAGDSQVADALAAVADALVPEPVRRRAERGRFRRRTAGTARPR
jgi:MinD-like ATPase involved in chromosome partitioning or flagellar assembly